MSEVYWKTSYQIFEKDNISVSREKQNWNEQSNFFKFEKELSEQILINIEFSWYKEIDELRKNLGLSLAAIATDKLSWFSSKAKLPISPKVPWEIIRFPDWAKYNPAKWTIDDFLKIVYQEVDSAVWNVKPSKFLKFWAKSLGAALWVLVELIFPTPFNEITWEELEKLMFDSVDEKIEKIKEIEKKVWDMIRKIKKIEKNQIQKLN